MIVGIKSSTHYAMSDDKGTASGPLPVKVTTSGDKLSEEPAANIVWTVGVNGENRIFYADATKNTWLYCTNSNNGVRVGTNTANLFAWDSNYLKHVETSRYLGIYNTQDWRCYTSNTATNIANQVFKFYVKVGGGETPEPEQPTLTPRDLAFSSTTATATVGQSFTAPTLSGVTTGVTYSSSNTAVATVDASTGAVTLVGAGTTTITATASQTDQYEAGTASYTLNVSAAQGGGEDSGDESDPEQPSENKTISVTFSDYAAGIQYAKNEVHVINDDLTITVNDGHFTTELRLYDSNSNNSTAWSSELPGYITNMTLNAGYKAATLNVYGSSNGSDWVLVTAISTKASYAESTIEFPADTYKYFKLDAVAAQIRVKNLSVTYKD